MRLFFIRCDIQLGCTTPSTPQAEKWGEMLTSSVLTLWTSKFRYYLTVAKWLRNWQKNSTSWIFTPFTPQKLFFKESNLNIGKWPLFRIVIEISLPVWYIMISIISLIYLLKCYNMLLLNWKKLKCIKVFLTDRMWSILLKSTMGDTPYAKKYLKIWWYILT